MEAPRRSSSNCSSHFQDSGRRKVRIQETAEAKPDLALAYLEYLFIRPSLRDQVLALGPPPLKQLHEVLGNWRVCQRAIYRNFISNGPRVRLHFFIQRFPRGVDKCLFMIRPPAEPV